MAHKTLKFEFPDFDCGFEFSENKPLFRITAQAPDGQAEPTEITPADFPDVEISEDGPDTTIAFQGSPYTGARAMKVIVHFHRDEDQVLASLDIELGGGFVVKEVRFPCVVWQPVQPFDRLMMPTAWGDDIERPTKTIQERFEGELTYIYPSMLAMQYMCLHNPGRCVYVSSYSTSDSSFCLAAKNLPKQALELSVVHYPFVESGKWESPQCGVAVLPGGWHAAADLYRSRMSDKFKAPDVPQWMRDEFHGWVQVCMKHEGEEPEFKFRDLPEVMKRIQATGLNVMHVFGWSGRAFDTEYPDYDINPELGTEDELRQAMDEIKALGGRAILYTNGRLVDPDSRYYQTKGGDKAICVDENGKPFIETYGTTAEFRIACPVCESYHQQMASEIGKIATEFRAHAVQIDQISCNYAFPCYDRSHSHPTPYTNFLPGVSSMLRKIRETHQRIDPEFFTWCEGCHEWFGQFYDVNQGHGEEFTWQIGESTPEQFKYTYPDYIVTGISDGIQKLCHTFAQGKPFDFHLKHLKDADFADAVRHLLAVRNSEPQYFIHGVFRDNVGIQTSTDARAFAIESPDGKSTLVNVLLPGTARIQSASASVKFTGAGSSVRKVYPEDLRVAQNGSWIDLEWQGPVATLAFE